MGIEGTHEQFLQKPLSCDLILYMLHTHFIYLSVLPNTLKYSTHIGYFNSHNDWTENLRKDERIKPGK